MKKKDYDVIVIGSGLGGLVCAAKLCKEGKKVLVIEQHNIIGGCASYFKRKDHTFDIALHEIDGFDKADEKTEIFKNLGLTDRITLVPVPSFYHFHRGDFSLTLPHDPDEAIEVLSKRFPKEKSGIKSFYNGIARIRKDVMRLPYRNVDSLLYKTFNIVFPYIPLFFPFLFTALGRTVGGFLKSRIKDPSLQAVLMGNFGYYHDDPDTMNLIYYAAAQGNYHQGSYYVKGGGYSISNALRDIIVENGGEILLRTLATRVVVEGGRVVGVEYGRHRHGNLKEKKISYAPRVVSNASIPSVANNLLDEKYGNKLKKYKKMTPSISLTQIYLGLKKSAKELGCEHYSILDMPDSLPMNYSDMFKKKYPHKDRAALYVDYSQVDNGVTPEPKGVVVGAFIDYYEDWCNLERPEYLKKKEHVSNVLIERFKKHAPKLKDSDIEVKELATPMTIKRYTLNERGAPYGYAQTVRQGMPFRPSLRCKQIEGLYFSSAWSQPGGGFTGAILSGWFCANQVLRPRWRRYLI